MWEEGQFKKLFKWYRMNAPNSTVLTMAVSQYDETSENIWNTIDISQLLISQTAISFNCYFFFSGDEGPLPIFVSFKDCLY